MADYRLHCFAQSGNAYKAALMLELTGLDWEPLHVDFFNGGTRTSAWRQVNPMGEVPVLQTPDGLTLTQSGVILDYLAGVTGRFGPKDEAGRREILRWLLWDNHKLTANLATGRFLKLFLAADKRNPDVITFLLGRFAAALKVLEDHLATRDWIVGNGPTIADLSCAGYIFFLDEVDLTPGPAVSRWADRIAALPGWRHPYDLMPGHPIPVRAQA
jgi:glutathione S-transferase